MSTPHPSTTSSPHLLSPFDLRGIPLRNRMVMAPLTRARAGRERVPNDLMLEYYTQRASAGLIISEATTISEQANGWVDSPGIYTETQEAGWRKIVAALHERGTPFFLQLWGVPHTAASMAGDWRCPLQRSRSKDTIHTPIGKMPHEFPARWRRRRFQAWWKIIGAPRRERRPRGLMAWRFTRPMDI